MPNRECKECGAANHVRRKVCSACGWAFPAKGTEAPITTNDDIFPAYEGEAPQKLTAANCPDFVELAQPRNHAPMRATIDDCVGILLIQLASELDRLGTLVLEQSLAKAGRVVKFSRSAEGTYAALTRRVLGLTGVAPHIEPVHPNEVVSTLLAFDDVGKATQREVLAPWDDDDHPTDDVFA